MDFSANSCPLNSDNTAAPSTETLCWNIGPFNRITIDIQAIDATTYEVVTKPDNVVIDTITTNGTRTYTVPDSSEICLRILVSGTGTAIVNAYLADANVTVFGTLCFPFFLFDGTQSNIDLIDFELPFFLFNGSPNNIPVVPC